MALAIMIPTIKALSSVSLLYPWVSSVFRKIYCKKYARVRNLLACLLLIWRKLMEINYLLLYNINSVQNKVQKNKKIITYC